MSRIICISNRISLPDPETGKIKAGGLAVGVKASLESNGGGIWFGWDGSVCKYDGKKRKIKQTDQGDITFLTFPLREAEYAEYYKGMANESLWPLMHGLGQHINAKSDVYATYKQVNKMFARRIVPYLKPGDVIWVHDYHLMPLGRELRALGVHNRLGYFHHVPMPTRNFVEGPDVPPFLKRYYKQLLGDLFHYDLSGFQSFRDFKNFCECLGLEAECSSRYAGQMLNYHGRMSWFGVFPISIETYNIARISKQSALQNPYGKNDCKTLIGAERLDYTKGLPYRLIGFYEFLDTHPDLRNKIQYHQITPLSRADINQYKTEIENTRKVVREIQTDFSDETSSPLIYSEEGIPRDILMGKLRHSDAGLVTPLIDGQNLVAKEYIAAQDPRNPGMLILSRHAGAAEELEKLGVLCVDPADPVDIAAKIHQALHTPLLERLEIYSRAISHLYRYDIEHWAESFLQELKETKQHLNFKDHKARERSFGAIHNLS